MDIIHNVDARKLSNVATFVSNNLKTEWFGRLLVCRHNLYWTGAGCKVFGVSRLDVSSRKISIGNRLDEARTVAVFPQRGYVNMLSIFQRMFNLISSSF